METTPFCGKLSYYTTGPHKFQSPHWAAATPPNRQVQTLKGQKLKHDLSTKVATGADLDDLDPHQMYDINMT